MLVQEISRNKKFWVVRSGDDGAFINHFSQGGIVAIGHIDALHFDSKTLSNSVEVDELLIRYSSEQQKNKASKSSASNRVGQVKRFIKQMEIGDIVITLSNDKIMAGEITSLPYRSIEDVVIPNEKQSSSNTDPSSRMPYSLRRKVKWGKIESRDSIPLAINNSFKANQTVFSINDHWKALNHWLSVVFISADEAYVSSRINKKEGVNNFEITEYSIIINKLEALASLLSANASLEISDDDLICSFESTYSALRENRGFSLETQQVFLSPGDLWFKTNGSRIKSVIFISAFLLLFTGEATFADEIDRKIQSDNSDKIDMLVKHIKKNENFNAVEKGLALNLPKQKITRVDENKTKNNEFPESKPADFNGI